MQVQVKSVALFPYLNLQAGRLSGFSARDYQADTRRVENQDASQHAQFLLFSDRSMSFKEFELHVVIQ